MFNDDDLTADPFPPAGESSQLVAEACLFNGRVEYRRVRRGCPARVIADFLPGREPDFADQEFAEVCWFPYTPSEREMKFALRLLQEGAGPTVVS